MKNLDKDGNWIHDDGIVQKPSQVVEGEVHLASGKHGFREEFASAFLAYLLSPKMDHGMGSLFLSQLLQLTPKETTYFHPQLLVLAKPRSW